MDFHIVPQVYSRQLSVWLCFTPFVNTFRNVFYLFFTRNGITVTRGNVVLPLSY